MSIIGRFITFIREDIWKIPTKKLPKKKIFFIKQLRIFLLSLKGFDEDKCTLRASALTFYTTLSIVPIIAMIFAIAKGFGFERHLENQLMMSFEGQQEVLNWVLTFAQSLLESTKGGILAGVGIVLLLWSVMKVLGNIEKSFNDIWEIKKTRPFIRKLTDYIAIVIIAPIFIIVSSSATVFISTYIKNASVDSEILEYVGPFLQFLMRLLPYLLITLLLTFLYMVMPNTKVKFKSAFIAGIVAGILFQVAQWGYVNFQVGVAKYNAIYGSFAALPLFLIWMQLSWLIVLFGAELSFANQNVDRYEFEVDTMKISQKDRHSLSLLIMNLVIRNFVKGDSPYHAQEISDKLEMPARIVNTLLYDLVESRLLVEVRTKEYGNVAYQPAEDINKMSVNYVVDKLENWGTSDVIIPDSAELTKINETLEMFSKILDKSEDNVLLKNI